MPQSAHASLGSGAPVSRPRRQVMAGVGTAVLIAVVTTVYYLLPVPGRMRDGSWVVLFCGGLVVLAALIMVSIARLLRAGPEARIRALVTLLCIAVLFFSWSDVVLAKVPGQFTDLHTKTDALYFSVSTLATVGFGDVHAAGQLARAAITVEIVFNLIFIGTAVAMITGIMRAQARKRMGGGGQGPGDAGATGPDWAGGGG
jgi:voltage-gated potassium channel